MGTRSRMGIAPFGTLQKYTVHTDVEGWSGEVEKPALLFCHGALGSGTQATDAVTSSRLLKALAEDYVVMECDWGGDLFGNDVVMGMMNDALAWLRSTWNASAAPPVAMGWSMGACQALNYALDNETSAVVAMIPVTDLEYVHANNVLGMAATINAAYGGTYTQAEDGPRNDPKVFAPLLDPDLPVGLFCSTNDALLPLVTAHRFVWARPQTMYKEWGAFGHNINAIGSGRSQVLEYLRDPAGYVGTTPPAAP